MDRNRLPLGGFVAASVILTMTVGLLPIGGLSTATAAPDRKPKATEKTTDSAVPIAVVTAASLDRLLDNVDQVFQSADRKDITALLRGLLGNFGNLNGMDRKKPFGVMLYLESGFPPRPIPIVFVPVRSMDDLLETLSLGPLNARKVDGKADRYEIVTPDRKFAMRVRHDYLFIAGSASLLDRALPDPAGLTRSLAAKYDLAASVNLKQVPSMARDMLRNLVLSRVASQRPQGESESGRQHQLRRAMAERHRKTADMMLKHATKITLGWKFSRKQHSAVLELALVADQNSPLVKRLNGVAAQQSLFAGLFADQTMPLTAALSWTLDPTERKVAASLIETARDRLSAQLSKATARSTDKDDAKRSSQQVVRLFEPLIETARNGHLDAFIRFTGNPPGHFVLVGGLNLAKGNTFPMALADFFKRIASLSGGKDIQPNVATYEGVAVHRVRMKKMGAPQRKFFGEKSSLYVGAARSTVWFAIGGEDALPALKKAMSHIARKTSVPADKAPPFQVAIRASSWLAMTSGDNKSKPLRDLGRQAFTKGGDTLRLEYRPTDRGARLRMTFGEGFIRLLGLAIAQRYDRSRS